MGIAGAIVIFVIVWWIVFFAVLPIGVTRTTDDTPGIETGAPERPNLKRKALVTTAIASVISAIIIVLVVYDIFSFREWARQMPL